MKTRKEIIEEMVEAQEWAAITSGHGAFWTPALVRCGECDESIASVRDATADIEIALEEHAKKHEPTD